MRTTVLLKLASPAFERFMPVCESCDPRIANKIFNDSHFLTHRSSEETRRVKHRHIFHPFFFFFELKFHVMNDDGNNECIASFYFLSNPMWGSRWC